MVLESWFTFPGKINVYVDEAFVPPSGRRSRVTLSSRNGANYYHPIARLMTVIVKGRPDGLESRVKLKLLKVVQVNLVVVETLVLATLCAAAPFAMDRYPLLLE